MIVIQLIKTCEFVRGDFSNIDSYFMKSKMAELKSKMADNHHDFTHISQILNRLDYIHVTDAYLKSN